MRFLHTADWHLGRLLYGVHLTEDQAHVLDQLVEIAREARPDAVVLAGDVFDRAVPPQEAVRLLDEVLTRLVEDEGIPVLAIAGNHDSPVRVEYGSRLLARRGLHVFGAPVADPRPVVLQDAHGPVEFHCLPYAEPPLVAEVLGEGPLADHDAAMRRRLARLPATGRRVLVAHAFVHGGRVSESERPLSVIGEGAIGIDAFEGFDYVALGHLHRPQSVARDAIRYSGSILKYSFSEALDRKGVGLVEIDAAGRCRIEHVPLVPRRDLRRLEGRFEDLLRSPPSEDYLSIALADRGPVLDAMGRLREVFPNLLTVERPGLAPPASAAPSPAARRGLGDAELFAEFFRQVAGQELGEAERAAFARVAEAARRAEREAGTAPR